jgi:chemotaxis protein histidine kinase CheA
MGEMDDIVREFIVESTENLDRLDQEFVALEKDPTDRSRLASIFRTIHTIKGTCGFLGFRTLEAVAHVGESLLVKLRDGVFRLDGEITTALLRLVDAVREILGRIEQTNAAERAAHPGGDRWRGAAGCASGRGGSRRALRRRETRRQQRRVALGHRIEPARRRRVDRPTDEPGR